VPPSPLLLLALLLLSARELGGKMRPPRDALLLVGLLERGALPGLLGLLFLGLLLVASLLLLLLMLGLLGLLPLLGLPAASAAAAASERLMYVVVTLPSGA
jgi:hypothetical protein